MDRRYLFSLMLILLSLHTTNAEIFSSIARVQNLFASTDSIIKHLDDYIIKEETRLKALKGVRKDLSYLQDITTDKGLTVPEHPIGAYSIVKTLYLLNQTVTEGTASAQGLSSNVELSGQSLPTDGDITGSQSAILRLQSIYQLNTSDLMVGTVKGRQIARLHPSDALSIAQHAQSKMIYRQLSVEWMKAAYEAHINNPSLTSADVRSLLLNLTEEYLKVSDLSRSWMYISKAKELYLDDIEVIRLYSDVEEQRMEMMKHQHSKSEISQTLHVKTGWWKDYAALCRGDPEVVFSDPMSSFCVLSPSSIPFAPVKTEVLSTLPFIAMFYDVLSNTEIVKFKDEAIGKLKRATVGSTRNNYVSEQRVGQLAWLDDSNAIIEKMSRRVMDITGLDVRMRNRLSSSEAFQVVNYGIGGQYEPHLDVGDNRTSLLSVPRFLLNSGERLATFMFYLSDVTEGGATVFTRARVRVPVVKNSAAFWYNLLRSGDNDPLTQHAGCPVLLGQKWVANKWIREHGQEFLHGCGLTPGAVHHEFRDNRWRFNTINSVH